MAARMANGEMRMALPAHLRHCPPRRQQGMALMWVMFVLFFMVLLVGTAIEGWSNTAQRAREQQLLWTGNEFRNAIRNYYELSPGGNKQFPQKLDDLLEDKRFVTLQRHLRKLYLDPMTDKPDWNVITDTNGRIVGVASRSERKPLKSAGFAERDKEFRNKQHYNEWQFVYTPNSVVPGTPGTPQTPPPGSGK